MHQRFGRKEITTKYLAQLTKFFSYDGKNQLTKNTPAIANPVKNHLFGCDKNVKETFIKVTSTSVLVICCNMFSPYKQITTKYLAQLSKHFSYDGKNAIFNHLGKMATLLSCKQKQLLRGVL